MLFSFGGRGVFWAFAIFITVCGTTRLLSIVTLWVPAYSIEGITKGFLALISAGADVNAVTRAGDSNVLMLAAQAGSDVLVKALVERGAEVDGRGDDRKRAVDRVVKRRKHSVLDDLRVVLEVAVFANYFEEEVVASEEVTPEGGWFRSEDAIEAGDPDKVAQLTYEHVSEGGARIHAQKSVLAWCFGAI